MFQDYRRKIKVPIVGTTKTLSWTSMSDFCKHFSDYNNKVSANTEKLLLCVRFAMIFKTTVVLEHSF